jgi:glycosyltransferase involved in cell wall biosynthesis
MNKKKLLYLSTNEIWGGSEILWTQSANELNKNGFDISVGVKYNYDLLAAFNFDKTTYINLQNHFKHPSIVLRILQKLRLGKFPPKNLLQKYLTQTKPDLVIISQGNNIEGKQFMIDCYASNIAFVTLTHLVTPEFWPSLNDEIISTLIKLYNNAKCNFFVSHNTLLLHEKLLGTQLTNSEIVYNPFTKNISNNFLFPTNKGIYKVALIGRIENFHKGYDLLIDVIKNKKWQQRPIHFSLFGKGPHIQLLKRLIEQNNITNFTIHNHQENISEIWESHEILLMPSRMEGQSLTLIEAMHFKRAAIVTNVGGTNELIEEGLNGFIAPYPSVQNIDEALERAWEKRDQWEQLGINAKATILQKHPSNAINFFNKKIETVIANK